MDKFWAMTVFARVAESGSFSRAAEALGLANASVTTCVRNLEKQLNVTLLHRDTRRLRLTEEGEVYLRHVRGILDAVEAAESDVQARQGALSGRLLVETPVAFGHVLLAPALPEFARRYPNIETTVTLSNQPHHLIERAIDVGIRIDRVEDAELVARPFFEARYVACCTPQLAATLPQHPGDLDPRLCMGVLPEEKQLSSPWELTRGNEHVSIRPRGVLHYNSSDALLLAAQAGTGVVMLLDLFCRRALDEGSVVPVYTDWSTPNRTFLWVTTKARLSSAKVRVFTDFLSEIVAEEYRPKDDNRAVSVRSIGRHGS